jgi:hypothetical protein
MIDPTEVKKANKEIARVERHLAKLDSQGINRETSGVYAIYEDLLYDLKKMVQPIFVDR